MAFSPDDLDVNPFFRCLETTFRSKYEEAQEKCWIVCIPQPSSVKGLKITGQIVDYHILKPSRYFKSQHVSSDKGESRAMEIEDGKIKIVSGGCNGYSVEILSEVLSYNKAYKPYKHYIISKPLDAVSASKVQRLNSLERIISEPKLSYKDCCSFLRSFDCHLETLNSLDKKLHIFNQNYVVLSGFLHDCSRKLQDFVHSTAKALLFSHDPPLEEQEPLALEIKSCVESYVLGKVHNKVFSVIRQKYLKEDQLLAESLQELYNFDLTPDQLGVRESFCCSLPSAVVELASLNSLVTPSEKLLCLKSSLEHIPEDIYSAFKVADNPFKKMTNIPELTSDDLIPLLVFVLVQARVQYLESNLFYIQNFTWHLASWDKQSFSFVTFQAAKEFIKSHNFSHLRPSSNKLKKEISLEELIEVTVELQKQTQSGRDSTAPTAVSDDKKNNGENSPSPWLERKTRMIEDSTREYRQQEKARNEAVRTRRSLDQTRHPDEHLGDFLSSFQKDGFGVNYGKQS